MDPSGEFKFSLVNMLITALIVGILASMAAGAVTYVRGYTRAQIAKAMLKWFFIGFAAGALAYVATWALVQMFGSGAGLGNLSRAKDFGIQSYRALQAVLRKTGLQAHHIIEKRFAHLLGTKASQMASVAVTQAEHQVFTNAWRAAIGYGAGTATATIPQLWAAAQQIYANYPALLEACRTALGM